MGNVPFTIEEENLICIYHKHDRRRTIPFNLICHAFKLVFHNWQEIIRPLCFPRCKAAPSKAYRHSRP